MLLFWGSKVRKTSPADSTGLPSDWYILFDFHFVSIIPTLQAIGIRSGARGSFVHRERKLRAKLSLGALGIASKSSRRSERNFLYELPVFAWSRTGPCTDWYEAEKPSDSERFFQPCNMSNVAFMLLLDWKIIHVYLIKVQMHFIYIMT